jgi:hypothetical protein
VFNLLLGRHWKFVPKRFLSPPREFKILYGSELRQTTLENFFPVRQFVNPVIVSKKIKKKYVQSRIDEFLKVKK